MNCHPVITTLVRHAWPHAYRAIRRRIRRHAHHAAAAGITIVCAGTPIAVLLLPPTVAVAPPSEPVDVPEPAGVWVLAVAGVGMLAIRWRVK